MPKHLSEGCTMASIRQTVGESSLNSSRLTGTTSKLNRKRSNRKGLNRERAMLLSTVALGVAGITSVFDSQAAAQTTTLFTTTSDFTGWVNDNTGVVTSVGPSTTFDFDG